MDEIATILVTSLVSLAVGYFTRLLMTRREKKHDDIQLLNEAINPLVESVRILTEQNKDLIQKLQEEQMARLQDIEDKRRLLDEKQALQKQLERNNRKIEELNRKIEELNRKIEELKGITREIAQDKPSNDN